MNSLSLTNPVLIEGLEPRRLFSTAVQGTFYSDPAAAPINSLDCTATWTGVDSAGYSHGDTPVTLTLSNLPGHTHRDLQFYAGSSDTSGNYGGAFTGSMTISLDGTAVFSKTYTGFNGGGANGYVPIETDSNGTATIQFTPSGFNANVESSFNVQTTLTQSEITIPHYPDLDEPTVGEVRLVHVNVKDYQSNPIAGDSVVLTSDNPAVVEVLSGPVTTDANGVAVVQIMAHDDTSYVNLVATSSFGGQKIDYTRGRWPMMQSFSATHADYSDQTTSSYYNTLILTQDADGKSLVDLDLSTYPNEEGKALFKYEVVRGTGQTVAAGTFATAPIVELTAPTPGDDAFYEFFAWLDKNNNGLRDTGEDVKTLGAQQAAHVITITPPANPITRPQAGAPDVVVPVTVTVTSNQKPVNGVFLRDASGPFAAGQIPPAPNILGGTNQNGTLVIEVRVTSATTPGTYTFTFQEDELGADRDAKGTFTIVIQ